MGLLNPYKLSRSSSSSLSKCTCERLDPLEDAKNHGSLKQSKADNRSFGFFFSIFDTIPLRAGEKLLKTSGNYISAFMMLLMVLLWQTDSYGVWPVINLQMRMPVDQMSTFQLYPPPVNISGARQQRVPVMVSMSTRIPLLLCFRHMPKSTIFIFLVWGSYRIFYGLMSRCVTDRWCRQCRVQRSCWTMSLSSCQEVRTVLTRLGAFASSMTSQQRCFLRSRYKASYLMMFLWLRPFTSMKLYLNYGKCSSQNMKLLAAYSTPLLFLVHLCTTPSEPYPTFPTISYFSLKISACSKLLWRVPSSASMLNPSQESDSDSASS